MEKIGLRFEAEFIFPPALMPDCTADERRGVKYSLTRAGYLIKNRQLKARASNSFD